MLAEYDWHTARVNKCSSLIPEVLKCLHQRFYQYQPLQRLSVSNRHNGWYAQVGQVDEDIKVLEQEIDEIYAAHQNQFCSPNLWIEKSQVDLLREYLDLSDQRYVARMQMWVFAGFKTVQGIFRDNGLNQKGVLTRNCKPKMAAHFLKLRWNKG